MKLLKVCLCLSLCLFVVGCSGDDDDATNNGGTNGDTNNATNNGGANNDDGTPLECPDDNPLVGSCGDLAFLGGCFEPDRTGTCSMTVSTEWEDGSKVERNSDGTGGFYGPGDTDACATFSYDMATSTTTFEKDGETWIQLDNGDGTFTMTCPDQTRFDYTADDSEVYNECRGITCPAEAANNGANNVSSCAGESDCPGSVCCQTAVSTSCVPDEGTCDQVGGTVVP